MSKEAPLFWLNAGEMSGDIHGERLMESLRSLAPQAQFIGMGGPDMRNSGLKALFRVEDLSVMGISEVLSRLPRIFMMLRRIRKELAAQKPDALIVIDAPSFNFRLARYAHELGIPVYYYISPKIWAWRTGRVKFIRRYIRKMLCILPFEVEFYQKFGMKVDYIGNPLVDIVNRDELLHITPLPNRIGLLPGSRKKEISSLMPEFCKAATILHQKLPTLEFHCVCAPGVEESRLRELWQSPIPLTIHTPQNRYEFMRSCTMLFAASGTVTLEAALAGTPTLVSYKVSKLSALVAKKLVKVPYYSLPNLVMGQEVFPELMQTEADGANQAAYALKWLQSPEELNKVREQVEEICTMLGEKGAPERAAKIIVNDLQENQVTQV